MGPAVALLSAVLVAAAVQERPRKTGLATRVDQILDARWSRPGPAPLAGDGAFLRRLSLDLRGRIPSEDEARRFLAEASATKRLEKIDEYLASPEFALTWSRLQADAMFPNYRDVYVQSGKNLVRGTSDRMMRKFLEWLAEQVARDVPAPKMLADLLEAYGPSDKNPLILYKLSFYNGGGDAAMEFADGFSRTWLGIRVSCARCHDHPFDDWKQEHYFGLAAFFTRQRVRHMGGKKEDECDEVELTEEEKGELKMPETEKLMPPTFLYGGKAGTTEPRLAALARLTVGSGARQLPRAVANRTWALLMGRGLVNPVDDFNRKNKPMFPELLEALTREYASHRYSLKNLIRGICGSDAYQRASARDGESVAEDFSRHLVRQLRAEQLFSSLVVAARGPEVVEKRGDTYRGLWDAYAAGLGMVFGPGVPRNEMTPLPGNTRQVLLLRNSDFANRLVRDGARRVARADRSLDENVEAAFLAVVTRPPREAERARWARYVATKGAGAYEDLVWTLVNSTEFFTRN